MAGENKGFLNQNRFKSGRAIKRQAGQRDTGRGGMCRRKGVPKPER